MKEHFGLHGNTYGTFQQGLKIENFQNIRGVIISVRIGLIEAEESSNQSTKFEMLLMMMNNSTYQKTIHGNKKSDRLGGYPTYSLI